MSFENARFTINYVFYVCSGPQSIATYKKSQTNQKQKPFGFSSIWQLDQTLNKLYALKKKRLRIVRWSQRRRWWWWWCRRRRLFNYYFYFLLRLLFLPPLFVLYSSYFFSSVLSISSANLNRASRLLYMWSTCKYLDWLVLSRSHTCMLYMVNWKHFVQFQSCATLIHNLLWVLMGIHT